MAEYITFFVPVRNELANNAGKEQVYIDGQVASYNLSRANSRALAEGKAHSILEVVCTLERASSLRYDLGFDTGADVGRMRGVIEPHEVRSVLSPNMHLNRISRLRL